MVLVKAGTLLLLFGVACRTAAPPVLPPPHGEAVVFVPGYKGTFLAAEDGQRAWLTPTQGLSSGDRSLALPFEGQREGLRFGPLHPDGLMTKLSVLFFGAEVYLSFLEFGRDSLPGFVTFPYDWRLDVRDTGRELCAFIDRLPATKVAVIGHSMGGLVALHCLRRGNAKIARVAFVGTPFAGAPTIFKDFFRGDTAGRNHALLSRDALFSFPAAWQLAPKDKDFLDAGGDPYTEEFWIASGRGVFEDPSIRADPAYRNELRSVLRAREGHWRELEGVSPSVPSLVVVGEGHPTEARVHLADLEHATKADGDGTVPSKSARPSFPHDELVSRSGHVELLQDADVKRALAAFVRAH